MHLLLADEAWRHAAAIAAEVERHPASFELPLLGGGKLLLPSPTELLLGHQRLRLLAVAMHVAMHLALLREPRLRLFTIAMHLALLRKPCLRLFTIAVHLALLRHRTAAVTLPLGGEALGALRSLGGEALLMFGTGKSAHAAAMAAAVRLHCGRIGSSAAVATAAAAWLHHEPAASAAVSTAAGHRKGAGSAAATAVSTAAMRTTAAAAAASLHCGAVTATAATTVASASTVRIGACLGCDRQQGDARCEKDPGHEIYLLSNG